jgi:EAL domain-containing protein (putative c-di-GMP-specific phosphodiesterase class I)
MESGFGVNSPEFLQKKVERLKTALDEANVLMDRQVTERDDARAQVEELRRANDDLKRQLAETAEVAAAADPAVAQELRDRVSQLEAERGAVESAHLTQGQELRDRIAQLEAELDAAAAQPADDPELRARVDSLQGELDTARGDLEAARMEAATAQANAATAQANAATAQAEAATAQADAASARAELSSAPAVAQPPGPVPVPDGDLPANGPFVSQQVIRDAIDNDDFVLFCQPVFSLQAERVAQYELLLRLRDGDGRMVRPLGFLEPADRYGLMAEIDLWVISQALDLLERDPTGDLRLEVNIAGQSLADVGVTSLIEERIGMTDLDPARLILEISENVAVAHLEDTQRLAKRLRGMGCGFALDDFGSTFASFRHLRDLPVNFLKIDGDLVVTVTESRTGQLTVRSLVELAKGLGAETIAEYVSDDQTLEFLREAGVGYAQGYRIGRPRPIDEVLDMRMTHEAPKRVQRPALAAGEEGDADGDSGQSGDDSDDGDGGEPGYVADSGHEAENTAS